MGLINKRTWLSAPEWAYSDLVNVPGEKEDCVESVDFVISGPDRIRLTCPLTASRLETLLSPERAFLRLADVNGQAVYDYEKLSSDLYDEIVDNAQLYLSLGGSVGDIEARVSGNDSYAFCTMTRRCGELYPCLPTFESLKKLHGEWFGTIVSDGAFELFLDEAIRRALNSYNNANGVFHNQSVDRAAAKAVLGRPLSYDPACAFWIWAFESRAIRFEAFTSIARSPLDLWFKSKDALIPWTLGVCPCDETAPTVVPVDECDCVLSTLLPLLGIALLVVLERVEYNKKGRGLRDNHRLAVAGVAVAALWFYDQHRTDQKALGRLILTILVPFGVLTVASGRGGAEYSLLAKDSNFDANY